MLRPVKTDTRAFVHYKKYQAAPSHTIRSSASHMVKSAVSHTVKSAPSCMIKSAASHTVNSDASHMIKSTASHMVKSADTYNEIKLLAKTVLFVSSATRKGYSVIYTRTFHLHGTMACEVTLTKTLHATDNSHTPVCQPPY